jgi:tetratricopeptide (TPR) repeat protein
MKRSVSRRSSLLMALMALTALPGLTALVSLPLFATPERDYEAGMKALAAKDYAGALNRLEAAVAGDPASLKLASEYRQAVIKAAEQDVKVYDRAIEFFEGLVAKHPASANASLNHGYAYVDKIPKAGSITQVLLANTALAQFSKAIELEPTWLALYTRGNSYLYWPAVFGRAPLGIADLERAAEMVRKLDRKLWRPVHGRTWVALGDGQWRLGNIDKARALWAEGQKLFPANQQLAARLAKAAEGREQLDAFITAELDPGKRVDTDLKSLWAVAR